ncbi:ubiquinone biosynthesis regulatory protein kinase UbiB [Gilliamella sp. Imp1-1]|uniref:ubiquinone biosynthesis regulatory protein kinase UbiB n=1 Tax=Gilliamella sp. Imp1-1 TaxID=3120248 RepID=UPI00046172BA|nr:ubiquinone biosynthesis regulatory protein kinase UbiB [Gilliamella apicola]KDN10499.1 Ubiquinone biosynthesis monooxygenase UbiB [Gilliamella apicola]OCG55149.1 ubiquinone biosynthesis regulatory protein kinase UbiB [Gilliamella apicola]
MTFFRLFKILTVFRAYQLNELLPKHRSSKWLRTLLFCMFWVRTKAKHQEIGERLRLALQELGPVWVKIGQMISTRRDILPKHIADALAKLQDQVNPFDGKIAKQIIESALEQPIDYYFADFDEKPIASASIAQVHKAILKRSQAEVVIKVLRPNILHVIQADIGLMYWVAKQLTKRIESGEKLRAVEIVHDYEMTLLKELDLQKEAYNTARLRDNFINSDILYIPYVYQDLCRKNVMVEERIKGIPIADINQLKQNNVDMKLLAERGVQAFFTQVFRDNFFHADMHPGNIFVDITEPQNPRYIGIDCAIVGILSADDQRYLAENFLAFFNRDYRKIAETYIASGWVPATTDVIALEMAMRNVCEPAFSKPLSEISFSQILLQLFQVARQFDMDIQPQLTLLEKTLFYIEGLGRQLYPELDLWQTAKPFLEKWYRDKYSAKKILQQAWESLPQWRVMLPQLPEKLNDYERISKQMNVQLQQINQELQRSKKREQNLYTVIALFCALCIIILIVH